MSAACCHSRTISLNCNHIWLQVRLWCWSVNSGIGQKQSYFVIQLVVKNRIHKLCSDRRNVSLSFLPTQYKKCDIEYMVQNIDVLLTHFKSMGLKKLMAGTGMSSLMFGAVKLKLRIIKCMIGRDLIILLDAGHLDGKIKCGDMVTNKQNCFLNNTIFFLEHSYYPTIFKDSNICDSLQARITFGYRSQ